MLCFISDLHLTEEDLPGSVPDADLAEFVRELGDLAERQGEPVTLVLLGDILELLRSPRWSVLWKSHSSAPWKGAGPGFANFAEGLSEACAIKIAQGIRSRYPLFEGEIAQLVKAGKLATQYVPGNHDYMVQLCPRLREILIEFLSLKHDAGRPFEKCFLDPSASVLATHGHTYDPINWHRKEDGYWAMGDAVVLRVVNRFAEDACAELGLSPQTHLGRLVQDVENIEPLVDLPIYIRWLSETQLAIDSERKALLEVWNNTVSEFLDIEHFKDKTGFSASEFSNLRTALGLSTKLGMAELIGRLAGLVGPKGPDYRKAADALGMSQGYRYVIFGHTHEPLFAATGMRGGEPSFYVNTGCWRRVVARTGSDASAVFVPRRVASHFLVHPAKTGSERYRLHQICRAI